MTIYAGTSGEEIGELAELTVDVLRRSASDMTDAEIEAVRVALLGRKGEITSLLRGLKDADPAERPALGAAAAMAGVPLEVVSIIVLPSTVLRSHSEGELKRSNPSMGIPFCSPARSRWGGCPRGPPGRSGGARPRTDSRGGDRPRPRRGARRTPGSSCRCGTARSRAHSVRRVPCRTTGRRRGGARNRCAPRAAEARR